MSTTRIRIDKQIQKASAAGMIPISDAQGELQYQSLYSQVKQVQTQTTLDEVSIVSGNLVIKYTGENGQQQVVSTALVTDRTTATVVNTRIENPSAGVYTLIFMREDGSEYPIDLSALLAVVTQSNDFIIFSGDGTPANPLTATPGPAYYASPNLKLDQLDDVSITNPSFDNLVNQSGPITLVFDRQQKQWIPQIVSAGTTGSSTIEQTEIYPGQTEGATIALNTNGANVDSQSIKVYRNGLRQAIGQDYYFPQPGQFSLIEFNEPFRIDSPETIIVDYRIIP